ncbi:UDP-2,4-diacetamido-2,4,6-trideoxy-beta-L-altropyranose hydrolase [Clostridium butyricum]|uniref:UDP-2,4-diacetamido-2,4, 6-trideoxy-beta-L-altropyranose hydrolase n=1 Tax=Clostridium butyricum TaxID=1492 RepID=UPI0013D0BB12|nr:UDP-2,4-diacetamido-2,4,6-trideoxy-beta-L-altropyranose hydrolase [Clostridium butyricum]MCQ2022230.1 UDP-2,4-diacetamido-2,4,6-trideoxy-beta-L-altropyranose hydrolase [Clostridium butyricum]NFB70083.1 UDP-2,4-diacetamido-2,4,6-trideoxy-beta-L-altropyranose hydrolase [Clostridium butyricum]NFB89870.1 UDP-2,4-diacetamido-2,4,6-trideoxy-beta-L-altropyranose hydrolase [Clostridium butyricum]
MKVFICADGGNAIGMGHVMRMVVLAKELEKTNEVIFVCKKDESGTFDAGINIIKQNDFKVEYISKVCYLDNIIYLQGKYGAECIITDSYDVDSKYFEKLKSYFKLTGYMDDVNKCYMNVDFIINQNINALEMDYSKTTNNNTKLFLGSDYCLIRDEFINAYNKKSQKKYVENILLTLGGMDDKENTLKVLKIIEKVKKKTNVVIGKSYSNELIEKLEMISTENNNIILHRNANMSELMCKCDIAISGCGSTIYELCVMKVPSIGLVIAENQKEVARKMMENKMIFEMFDINSFDEEKFELSIYKLINNIKFNISIIEKQKDAIDILGKYKLVNQINKLIKDGNTYE